MYSIPHEVHDLTSIRNSFLLLLCGKTSDKKRITHGLILN